MYDRGAIFWPALRAVGFFNSAILFTLILVLWWHEAPATYPPADGTLGEGLAVAASQLVYAFVMNWTVRHRIASAAGRLVRGRSMQSARAGWSLRERLLRLDCIAALLRVKDQAASQRIDKLGAGPSGQVPAGLEMS